MKYVHAVFNIIALAIILVWLGISVKQYHELNEFYSAQAMKVKTEYSSSAAMYEYINNKAFWVDIYQNMMCLNYDLALTQDSYDKVLDSVASAIFVSDQSIELLTLSSARNKFTTQVISNTWDMSANEVILFDLFNDRVTYMNKDTLFEMEAIDIYQLRDVMSEYGVTIPVALIESRKKIIKAELINKALLQSYMALDISADRVAYVPVNTIEQFGINDVKGKTLIIVQKDFNKWNKNIITTAGYLKTERDWVVGWMEGGIKYYCMSDEAPTIANQAGNRMFKTVYDAARAGYHPALQYFR